VRYRAEIDGLRAIAVAVVVFFHADLAFRGGFVGVDVFFVISGFLITGLILRDLRNGDFSLVQFWERRVRRILPALFFMVFVVLAAGWILLLPSAYEELAKSSLWQVLMVSNVFFWRHTGYFAGVAEEKPLLHTWSLAVEEQFYVVVPMLLLLCWSLGRHRRPAVAALIGGLTVFGLLLSAYGVAFHRSAAFFLLPFRAWELALGGALACLPLRWFHIGRLAAEVGGWGGLAMIMGAAFYFDKSTPFPGFAALLPCAGAALIIWTSTSEESLLRRLLSLRPLVFVGLISYSLYLWHWPILAFARYWALEPLSTNAKIFFIALASALAVFSYYCIEQPFRRRKILAQRRKLFVWAGATNAILLLAAVVIAYAGGVPARVDAVTNAYSAAVDEKEFIHELTPESIRGGDLPRLGAGEGKLSVLLWGDSHAMALAPAVDELLLKSGLSGKIATHSSTAPLVEFTRFSEYGLGDRSLNFGQAVLNYVADKKIPNVILAAHWGAYPAKPEIGEIGYLESQILETVRALKATGTQPWVVLSVPLHKASIPKVLLRAELLGDNPQFYLDDPHRDWNGITGTDEKFVQRLRDEGAKVIDPRSAFIDETGNSYTIVWQGRPLYRDEQHLTPYGARKVVAPLLMQAMSQSLSGLGHAD
jgi:peptidoglycan/LPS O-acetylase OafA/YrhL